MSLRIRLRGVSLGIEGQIWESRSLLRVGRLKSLEVPLDENSVSRRHAEFRLSGNGWVVRDLRSTNGSSLNGARLGSGSCPIKNFDVIRFGDVVFVVEMFEGAEGEFSDLPPEGSDNRPTPGHCPLLWHVATPGNRPLATPAIANGRVFFGGGFGSHEFYACSADTGEQLWKYHTRDDGPTAAIVEEDLVAFNTESCELEVLTVEGMPVWKRWLGDPLMSMPAAAHGRVFIVYPDSKGDHRHYLACFDLRTGRDVWRKPVNGPAITAPVLAEGNVYLATLEGTLWCFRQNDGTALWNKSRSATSSPALSTNTCYYSRRQQRHDSQYECLSSSELDKPCHDFESSWSRADYLDYGKRQSNSNAETLFQTLDTSVGFHAWKGDSNMENSQANLGHGTVAGVWSYQGSKPFIYCNRLYNCMGAFVQCLDLLSGQIIWRTRVVDENLALLDHVLTPPALVNGKVFLATVSGEVICLSANSGGWLWREILGEPITFQPAVANGRVYVSTATGHVYCLDTGDDKDDGWLMWGGTASHNGVDEDPKSMTAIDAERLP